MEKEKQEQLATGVAQGNDLPAPDTPFIMSNNDGSSSIYFELATGSVVRRDDFTTTTWDNDPAQWTNESVPAGAEAKIKKAVKYYSKDPLVNKSIKLLAQLANDSFRIACEDKGTEEFFTTWWKDIGGKDFLVWFFLEYFRSGNVPIFKTLIPYIPQTYDPNTPPSTEARAKAISKVSVKAYNDYQKALEDYDSTYDAYLVNKATKRAVNKAEKAVAATQKTWQINSIPGAYTILNPLSIEIEGPAELPWLRTPKLKINDEIKTAISSPSKEMKEVVKNIPKEVVKEIKKGEDKVVLPDYLCTIVTRDKQPYETWAEPLCTHAFDALDLKQEMKTMDRHTVRGVRNRILKVTIGSDEFPVFDNKQLEELAKNFNNPSRNLTIFWNHTLAIDYIEPKLDSLKQEKYEPVMEDIRTCFGVAKILTGNEGSSIGNNILNLKGLSEVVAEAQDAFLSWFYKEMKRVAEATSMPKMPEAYFSKLNLKDENEFIRVLATLVDRQLISYETMVETIGYHFPKELDRLEKEQKIRDEKNILVPQTAPTQQEAGPTGNNGRPPGKKEDEKRDDREGKPRMPSGEGSYDPYYFNQMRMELNREYQSSFDAQVAALRDEGKRITTKREEQIAIDSLAQVAANITGSTDKGGELLMTSLQVAKQIKNEHPEAKMEEVVLNCMATQAGNFIDKKE